MTRAEYQALIDVIATGEPNTALEVRTILNALADGSYLTGDIKMVNCTNVYLTANFDSTGLGIAERLGWAICNGANGTRNMNGKVPLPYGSSYLTLGATGGETTHTLTVPELPSHTHDFISYVQSGSNDGSGGEAAGYFATVPTAPTGGGLAHNNMQPYVVTLFIQKL